MMLGMLRWCIWSDLAKINCMRWLQFIKSFSEKSICLLQQLERVNFWRESSKPKISNCQKTEIHSQTGDAINLKWARFGVISSTISALSMASLIFESLHLLSRVTFPYQTAKRQRPCLGKASLQRSVTYALAHFQICKYVLMPERCVWQGSRWVWFMSAHEARSQRARARSMVVGRRPTGN